MNLTEAFVLGGALINLVLFAYICYTIVRLHRKLQQVTLKLAELDKLAARQLKLTQSRQSSGSITNRDGSTTPPDMPRPVQSSSEGPRHPDLPKEGRQGPISRTWRGGNNDDGEET